MKKGSIIIGFIVALHTATFNCKAQTSKIYYDTTYQMYLSFPEKWKILSQHRPINLRSKDSSVVCTFSDINDSEHLAFCIEHDYIGNKHKYIEKEYSTLDSCYRSITIHTNHGKRISEYFHSANKYEIANWRDDSIGIFLHNRNPSETIYATIIKDDDVFTVIFACPSREANKHLALLINILDSIRFKED